MSEHPKPCPPPQHRPQESSTSARPYRPQRSSAVRDAAWRRQMFRRTALESATRIIAASVSSTPYTIQADGPAIAEATLRMAAQFDAWLQEVES